MPVQNSRQSSSSSNTSKSYTKYKSNKKYYKQMQNAEKGLKAFNDNYKNLINNALAETNKPFEFNAAANPVYQQYSNDYRLMGNIAAAQSEAQTDALSGGFGTTYGGAVANQLLQGYLANENQTLPQFYQVERANHQADIANAQNKANLFAQLSVQDQERYQKLRELFENNREYAYQKWMNNYLAHATSVDKSTQTDRNSESTTQVTPLVSSSRRSSSSRRGSTTKDGAKLTQGAIGSYKGAQRWMIANGYDKFTDDLLTRQEYVNERFKTNRNYYNGYEGKGDPEAEAKVDTDYSKYIKAFLQKLRG